jgi:hypothetical protein
MKKDTLITIRELLQRGLMTKRAITALMKNINLLWQQNGQAEKYPALSLFSSWVNGAKADRSSSGFSIIERLNNGLEDLFERGLIDGKPIKSGETVPVLAELINLWGLFDEMTNLLTDSKLPNELLLKPHWLRFEKLLLYAILDTPLISATASLSYLKQLSFTLKNWGGYTKSDLRRRVFIPDWEIVLKNGLRLTEKIANFSEHMELDSSRRPARSVKRARTSTGRRNKSAGIISSGRNSDLNNLFYAVRDRQFGWRICFLCGRELAEERGDCNDINDTGEHVIPLWIQNRFNILNERLQLLNGTTIPYRQLKIPCCYECNHDYLAPYEHQIQATVEIGASAVAALDQKVLFTWLGKIFYGLLYKELLLPVDRAKPAKGQIAPRELLLQYQFHHLFLQSVRLPIVFQDFFPASFFIFEAQQPTHPRLQFDFRDSLNELFISIRVGKVAIIGALQDSGSLSAYFAELQQRFRHIALHPLQYLEIVARLAYQASLFNRIPKYVSSADAGRLVFRQMSLAGLSAKPIYDTFDEAQYAQVLSQITGLSLAQLYPSANRVMTWLTDIDGKERYLDLATFPWP